ncbi:MAG: sigma-70 family RNA polymerase sigma factor [Actinomycetota bacterium]
MTDLDETPTGPQTVFRAAVADGPGRPSFEELYRAAYPSMVRLAISLVDRRAEAEQIVQDAFVGLFRHFDVVDHPAGYVRTSVVNGCRRVLRRRRLARTRITPDVEVAELGVAHTLDAVRRLPVDQRVLITLRYHQHLTDSEIARELDIPLGTVKSRLHRALARLREELS